MVVTSPQPLCLIAQSVQPIYGMTVAFYTVFANTLIQFWKSVNDGTFTSPIFYSTVRLPPTRQCFMSVCRVSQSNGFKFNTRWERCKDGCYSALLLFSNSCCGRRIAVAYLCASPIWYQMLFSFQSSVLTYNPSLACFFHSVKAQLP